MCWCIGVRSGRLTAVLKIIVRPLTNVSLYKIDHSKLTSEIGLVGMSGCGRLCCKSPFPLLIKNSLGCRCVFRINIWGTSSHSDELTCDFGNEPGAISIGDHGLSRLLAEKLSPRDLELLQQNLPISAASHPSFVCSLSYMRELPAEPAIVPRNELAAYGVGCWLSRHRDLTLDRRKRGHAFQPGMAW